MRAVTPNPAAPAKPAGAPLFDSQPIDRGLAEPRRSANHRTPTAFRHGAQGCRAAATLGSLVDCHQPQRGCALPVGRGVGGTPLGFEAIGNGLPRVGARSSRQPWALRRNAVGVLRAPCCSAATSAEPVAPHEPPPTSRIRRARVLGRAPQWPAFSCAHHHGTTPRACVFCPRHTPLPQFAIKPKPYELPANILHCQSAHHFA